MEQWEGKIAVVTGTTSGIGWAIATRLVESGLKVVGLARREDRGKQLEKELKRKKGEYYHLTTDITKEEDVLNAFKWIVDNLGPLHILVNNAGIGRDCTLIDGETHLWKEVFDVNFTGTYLATKEAYNIMKMNDTSGHIVFINSIGGLIVLPLKNANVYSASKFAVTALEKSLRELNLNTPGSQIKVSSICPGIVDTEIFKTGNAELFNLLPKIVSLKPDDIADEVLFILSRPSHVVIEKIVVRPINQPF